MYWNVYSQWLIEKEKSGKAVQVFCTENGLSYQNLQQIHQTKQQYLQLLSGSHLIPRWAQNDWNDWLASPNSVLTAIGCGLYPNIAYIDPEKSVQGRMYLRSLTFSESVQINRSSLVTESNTRGGWFAYASLMRMELSGGQSMLSTSEISWIPIYPVLLASHVEFMSDCRNKSVTIMPGKVNVGCIARNGIVLDRLSEAVSKSLEARMGLVEVDASFSGLYIELLKKIIASSE